MEGERRGRKVAREVFEMVIESRVENAGVYVKRRIAKGQIKCKGRKQSMKT